MAFKMLRVVCLVVATGVCRDVLVDSGVVGKCTSNGPGSWGLLNGVEFGIASYFSFEITNGQRRFSFYFL